MESNAENGIKRNDVLSQSYAECLERVAQQKNNSGFTFDLPKEVLEEREKVWDNFFDKYADEVSDEVELDMNTMKPVAAADEEEDDDDEEDDEEDDEDKEYYSKCRAPLRKLPALIQYWIDTGNPPYQLVGDDDDSETGSSLSEGEHSRSGHSAVLRESSDKHKSNTSRCSSVDTAAYILSNTNTTKKSETMAILEGAKISDEHFISKASPHKEKVAESNTKSAIIISPNRGRKSPTKIVQPATPEASKISSECEKTSTTNASKSAQANHSTDLASRLLDVSMTSQQSVKLSEILPELQEFDEMLKKANVISPPKTRSPLALVRKAPKCVEPEIAITESSQSSQNASVFTNGQNRLQNRRKLYTGRDSPVDLALDRTKDAVVQYTVRRSLHPALQTPSTRNDKIARLAARVRRRKRKRASQISEINSQDGNTSQESNQLTGQENSKSDERYTDFFESLGLTPSKSAVAKPRPRKPPVKRSKKIERQILHREAKNVAPINDSIESSLKESSQTEDSGFSPMKKARVLGEIETTENCFRTEEQKRILGDKILSVRIEKLSDDFLARYKQLVLENTEIKKFGRTESQTFTTPSSSSSGKKDRRSKLEKIELLTTMTHDSDSSTILICSCNDNVEQCDSDGKTLSRNSTQTKRRTFRTRASQSPTKAVNDAAKSESTQDLDKLPFVQLEKMSIDNQPVNNTRRETKSDESADRKDSKIVFKTALSPMSQRARSSLRNGKKIDLFGSKADDVTIGSRIFGEPNSSESAENSRGKYISTRARCSLGISIPSDEEEDSFVKLISGIGSQRDSTKVEKTNHEKDTKINSSATQNLNNGDGRIQKEKPRKLFAVSMSSDEEDVYVRKSMRRTRNSDSRNDEKRRETRKIKDNLLIEANKKEDDVKVNNQIDESKCKKMMSDSVTEDEVPSGVPNGKTRGSRGHRKTKNNNLSTTEVQEEVKVDDESHERTGRRKTLKNRSSASKDEVAMEVDESEARRSNDVRRSTRYKSPASSLPKNQTPVENSFAKPKETRTLFANSKEPGLKGASVLLTENERDSDLRKTNLGAGSVLGITGQKGKSENRATPRVPRHEKKIVRNSLRFQTRLDSDSDAEFEGLRFSLNDKYIPRSRKEQTNDAGIAKSNGITSSNENAPEIDAPETIRTSPRRSFKSLVDKQPENGENELKKRRRNLFDDEAKRTEKSVVSLKNEATDIEAFWKNESLLLNEFPIKGKKDSNEKQIKTRSKVESQPERKSRNSSKKSDKSKNKLPLTNQHNGETHDSPLAKKKKGRRPRILGKTMDWASDDETDSNDNKISLRIANQSKGLESLTNGYRATQLSNKHAIDDRESSRKQQSTSLFPTSSDEIAEDVDLLFNSSTKSRGAKNAVLIPKLNFTDLTKHKNLSSVGMSSIRFRTRLRSDTEDEEES